mmetsp:Transcript_96626/g.269623  ORF Transcript_96626/g.269623 Transcript_96626/m.269623 type:complete len:446 (+) Transcript_96626:202-1539(+)
MPLLLEDGGIHLQDLVARVHALEHILPESVAQAQRDHLLDVVIGNLCSSVEGAECLRGPVCDDVTPEAVHVQLAADLRDLARSLRSYLHLLEAFLRRDDLVCELLVVGRVFQSKALRVGGELLASLDNLHAQLGIPLRADQGVHAEAVEQLRSELALLWVAASHEDELRRVAHADALTLDGVPTSCSTVQQHINEVVVQEVHLVHVQNATVRLGKQSWLEGLLALRQGLLDVDGAAHAILCGSERQVDHRHLHRGDRKVLALPLATADVVAHNVVLGRRGVVGVARHARDLRKEVHEGADRGRLAGATVTQDHDAADLRVDHIQEQGQLHLGLSHDGCEREDRPCVLVGLHRGLRYSRCVEDGLLRARPAGPPGSASLHPHACHHGAASRRPAQPGGSRVRGRCPEPGAPQGGSANRRLHVHDPERPSRGRREHQDRGGADEIHP